MPNEARGKSLSVRIEVSWGDCDPAGIVFYPRFFAWMDSVSHVLARAMGIHREQMLPPRSDLVGFPIVGAQAQFSAPVRIDDVLEVRTRVCRIGATSFSLSHSIVRMEPGGGETQVASGREDRVFVGHGPDGIHPRPLTAHMREVLQCFAETQAGPD